MNAVLADGWRAFLHAARFLTRAPLPDPGPPTPQRLGQSTLFYPLVGAWLGAWLAALAWLLAPAPSALAAALALVGWVWATGALHLDGLADCADAWVCGLGSRARTLEILRDPRIGTMGAVTVVLALLVKWASMDTLFEHGAPIAFWLWVPALARAQLLLLGLTTPYAREQGMGAALRTHLPRRAAWVIWALSWALAGVALGALTAMIAGGVTGAIFAFWRRSLCQRLGGFTGDGAGALVELSEIGLLLALLAGSA